jgi:hypothetical protein
MKAGLLHRDFLQINTYSHFIAEDLADGKEENQEGSSSGSDSSSEHMMEDTFI